MSSINMNGEQSSMLNEIKTAIRNGDRVSHILNVKVSKEPNNKDGTSIRQAIYKRIANQKLTFYIDDIPVTIQWKCSSKQSSAYYYSYVRGFTDEFVKEHTSALLRDFISNHDAIFGGIFTSGLTGLAFVVSRPLAPVPSAFLPDDLFLPPLPAPVPTPEADVSLDSDTSLVIS